MSDDDAEDDAVGYGKPPKKHQFPKGKSGNLKGRPKGAKGLKSVFNQTFDAKLSVKINGKTKTMTAKEIAIQQLAKKAMAGDHKATVVMIQLDAQFAPIDETVTNEDHAADLTVLSNLIALQSKFTAKKDNDSG